MFGSELGWGLELVSELELGLKLGLELELELGLELDSKLATGFKVELVVLFCKLSNNKNKDTQV